MSDVTYTERDGCPHCGYHLDSELVDNHDGSNDDFQITCPSCSGNILVLPEINVDFYMQAE